MAKMESIGIVLTCYQYGEFIPEAVASILAQSRRPDRVVMVDDASGDGSAEILRREMERLEDAGISCEVIELFKNQGSAAARNAGIEVIDTEWVMNLDGDDLLTPRALELVAASAYRGRRRSADVVIGPYEAFGTGKNGNPARGVRNYVRHKKSKLAGVHPYVAAFLQGHRIGCSNSAYLRRLWEISPYDTELQNSEDTAFWMRCAQNAARFTVSPEPLSKVRFHPSRKSFAGEKWPLSKRVEKIREIISTPPPVEFMASERHFIDHLAPVWLALPARRRGRFITSKKLRRYAEGKGLRVATFTGSKKNAVPMLALGSGPVVSCSSGDQVQVSTAGRASIFFEHGAGQTYKGNHSSYAGYKGRKGVILFIVPGDRPEAVNRVSYPSTPIVAVGCAKLDPYLPAQKKTLSVPPVVAVSFHWDCPVYSETKSAYPEFEPGLRDLLEMHEAGEIELLGHGHPRIWNELRPFYEELGIEAVTHFEELLGRMDLYVCDNSSTIFESAAVGIPVVLMNSKHYRKNQRHGLRFWDEASIGMQVDRPEDLAKVVREALLDPPSMQAKRRASVDRVYRFTDGRSSYRAALAIMDASDGMYVDPLHRGKKLRILKPFPSPNIINRGRTMSQINEPKTEILIAKTDFRNKLEEGHVRAGRAFITRRSRVEPLLKHNARYPTNSKEDQAEVSRLEREIARAGAKPEPRNPKREKPTGPSTTKPAGPSTDRKNRSPKPAAQQSETTKQRKGKLIANEKEAMAREAGDKAASKEVQDLMAVADLGSDEEAENALSALEANETAQYKGYTIAEADGGGWREIRDGEGALVKRLQGVDRCIAYIDDLESEENPTDGSISKEEAAG